MEKLGRIYGRESSDDTERAPSVQNQIDIGTRWFSEKGFELAGIYSDVGLSGGNWRRPELLRLLDEIKRGEFLWIWSQNRLARDTEMFLWIVRQLKEKDCILYIDGQPIDMNTAGGILKHTVVAATDEFYRRETSDKVKRAYSHKLTCAREAGKKIQWGRSEIPAEIAQEALRLAREQPRLTVRQIASMLPNYRLKSKKTPTYRKPSIGWVCKILNSVQKSPSENTEEKPLEKAQFNNNPIDEQK